MSGKSKKGYTLGRSSEPLFDLTLPSGQTCQARRPGVKGLIKAGMLDNFDQLTALVQTEHVEKNSSGPRKATAQDMVALARDKEKLEAGFELIDKLVAYVVTQPKVWVNYKLLNESDEEFEKRRLAAEESDAVPVEYVELEDKIYLLNWAVGTSSDLTNFRQGLQSTLADMATVQSVQNQA